MTTLGPSNLTLELPAATPDFTARVDSGLGLLVECRITGSRDFHENTLLKTLSPIIKINQNLCTVAKFLSRVRCRRSWIPWMPVPYFMNNRVPGSRQSAWIEISAFVLYPLLTNAADRWRIDPFKRVRFFLCFVTELFNLFSLQELAVLSRGQLLVSLERIFLKYY